MPDYKKNSLTLRGSVALGTGVMIGAGIFALLGQVAQLSHHLFPIAFILGALVTAFSSYTYVKMSNTYPSAGGIGMYLMKAYGKTTVTAGAALLMAFSMVINESLVARTFGHYISQLFDSSLPAFSVPLLGVALLAFTYIINLTNNERIQNTATFLSAFKIIGILLFAIAGLWVSNLDLTDPLRLSESVSSDLSETTPVTFIASIALCILAYKGFTTITNSGSEIKEPHKNVGRSIIISILICTVLYLFVNLAVAGNLSVKEIIEAKDYALAEAARPALGQYGVTFTVIIAIIATVSGIMASVFAVSRMLAMLFDMQMIPLKTFGFEGHKQRVTLTYTIVLATILTLAFDLSRIASIGAIYYILMDIIIHVGVLRHLVEETKVKPVIVVTAVILDVIVLGAFIWVKLMNDPFIIVFSAISIPVIFIVESLFLRKNKEKTS